jgi:hypothetical protein
METTVTKITQEPQTREARKAALLHTWNTEKLQRLPEFLQGLSPEDAEILLEGYQEQLDREYLEPRADAGALRAAAR